jgi:DNA-binding LacI/PurR family transcriptional regulator
MATEPRKPKRGKDQATPTRVSLERFAREVGVSPTTVSHALSGHGRVSPATREMILRRMGELGYVPNRHAQQLASGRSRFLLVHAAAEADVLPDAFIARHLLAVEWAARRRGYVPIFDAPTEREGARFLLETLRSRTAAGTVLLDNRYVSDELLAEIAAPEHPVVRLSPHDYPLPPYAGQVVTDVGLGIGEMLSLLASLGHRRLGALIGSVEDSVWEALADLAPRHGIALAPEHVVTGVAASGAEGSRGLWELLARCAPDPAGRPTAIFVRKDEAAAGALAAARELGLRVPEDLSVAGFDDIPFSAYTHPPLTTVAIDVMRSAELVVDTLCRLIDATAAGKDPPPLVGRVETRLVVRGSVGPAPPLPPSH